MMSVGLLCFVVIVCAEPPVITNASIPSTYNRYFKDMIHYECNDNLRMEDGFPSKNITCMANERWSNEVFSCAGE